MVECCRLYELEPFLTADEWKATMKFEGTLRETTRLATVYQNEDELNSACGPATHENLHGSSSSDSIDLMNADQWCSNKIQMHPTRSDTKVEYSSNVGEICRRCVLLETKRRFLRTNQKKPLRRATLR